MPDGEIEAAFYADMGKKIEAKRKKQGLSQSALGELVGVHRNTICRWETGDTGIQMWHMLRLADVLFCPHLSFLPPKDLVWGDGLQAMSRERDPVMRALLAERDPAIYADEEKKLRRTVA